MRTPFIAGNWKMNTSRAEAVALAQTVALRVGQQASVDVAVCPPFPYLEAVGQTVQGSAVGLGGQNMYFKDSGAYTGEVSPVMLCDVGCRYVILGHSERRQFFGETDEIINQKVHAALAVGLIPIVCVGEVLEDREAGRTQEVVRRQFDGSLAGLTAEQAAKLVIAYEPVWAIGTGKVATKEQAEEVHLDLRKMLTARYNASVADQIRIQYGGSVKPSNAAELLSQPNVDGALVGGASLAAEDFLAIVAAAQPAK